MEAHLDKVHLDTARIESRRKLRHPEPHESDIRSQPQPTGDKAWQALAQKQTDRSVKDNRGSRNKLTQTQTPHL